MQLRFKCRVCECEEIPIPDKNYLCFQEHTSCFADWLDMSQPLPELEEKHFYRSDDIPKRNEKRFVKVEYPFCCEVGGIFKTMFLPALSSCNGIGEPPEELEQSAMVTCRLDEILCQNEFCAWIAVTVIESILFSELSQVYPKQVKPELFQKFKTHNPHSAQIYSFSWERWDYDEWTVQGDFGKWKLFFTDSNGKKHLLLLFHWSFCEEILYFGNITES